MIVTFKCSPNGCDAHTAVSIRDDSIYNVECICGNSFTAILKKELFEILFESGANAFLDGYYREAVTSFATALERFYEFAIKVMMSKQEIDVRLFDDTWKLVKSQSERQLGGFIFCWLAMFQETPDLLKQNSATGVSFRNAVTHKGKIPTKEEAFNFGERIFNLIETYMKMLRGADCSAEMRSVNHQTFKMARDETGSSVTRVIQTILDLRGGIPKDFTTHMERLSSNQRRQRTLLQAEDEDSSA